MRGSLERFQVVAYLAVVLADGMAGLLGPAMAERLELRRITFKIT